MNMRFPIERYRHPADLLAEAIINYGIVRGCDVPQPEPKVFLEVERVVASHPNSIFTRKWFHLDNVCQKDWSHIPERGEDFIKRVRKTRNHRLLRKLHKEIPTGLMIEQDIDEEWIEPAN